MEEQAGRPQWCWPSPTSRPRPPFWSRTAWPLQMLLSHLHHPKISPQEIPMWDRLQTPEHTPQPCPAHSSLCGHELPDMASGGMDEEEAGGCCQHPQRTLWTLFGRGGFPFRHTTKEMWTQKVVTTHHAHGPADRVYEAGVQGAVIHGQGVILVMLNQVHHRVELQGLHKAVLVVFLQNLDQFVAPSFPEDSKLKNQNQGYLESTCVKNEWVFWVWSLHVPINNLCQHDLHICQSILCVSCPCKQFFCEVYMYQSTTWPKYMPKSCKVFCVWAAHVSNNYIKLDLNRIRTTLGKYHFWCTFSLLTPIKVKSSIEFTIVQSFTGLSFIAHLSVRV